MKSYSESSEHNKAVIAEVLREVFSAPGSVLEIGSGTGQQAVYFSKIFPHLNWQPTDLAVELPGIQEWIDETPLPNLRNARALDVSESDWDLPKFDYVYSSNTTHIMAWTQVEAMFRGIAKIMNHQAVFALYGPFNYHGYATCDSNQRFDLWLRARDPLSGLRDFDYLNKLAADHGMELLHDFAMPGNNRTLMWKSKCYYD